MSQPTAHMPMSVDKASPANEAVEAVEEVEEGEAPRYRWVVLGLATFTQAASCFFVQGIGALSLVLRHALGLSTTQLGLLLSASQLVPLIGLLVTGELLDRYNERWVVGIGGCVVAVGLGLGSLAPGYAWLMAAMLLVGAGYSTAQPGGSKSVAGWFGPSQRGLAMGVRQAGLPLGGALAAAVLPVLARAVGWRAALVTGALTALVGAVVFVAFYRRPPREEAPRTRRTDGAASRTAPKAPAARFALLRTPAVRRLLVSGMCLVSVHAGITMLAVLYLGTTTSLGTNSAALVLVGVQIAGGVGRVVLAAWSDRSSHGRYRTVAGSMVAVVAGMAVLMTPAGHVPAVAVADFVWLGFFGIGWYGPWVAHLSESAPPDRAGFTLGAVMAVNQIAVIAAPPLLGLVSDLTHGYTAAWGLLSVATVVAVGFSSPVAARARAGRGRDAGRRSRP